MNFEKGCHIVLKDCLDLKSHEKVLIVTDDNKLEIGISLYQYAKNMANDVQLILMPPILISGKEPGEIISKAMSLADVIVCPTIGSLTHTNAKIEAVKNGARVVTMPGITLEMFKQGAITADYVEIKKETDALTELLTSSQEAVIKKDGYTLTMSLKGRNGISSNGIYRQKGESGNLPTGEAYIAPLEGSASGEMLIDGSMVGIGKLSEPLYVRLENGLLKEIKGKDSEKLNILLENERNANLAELGIGTNPCAVISGNILEDEKVSGTVHIAFGTNTSFGGVIKADCHMDGIILKPNLYLDGKLIIQNGVFLR